MMKPPPHLRARSWNSGSWRRNMYFAHSGMFDQTLIPKAPSGAISPVETSPSTTIRTRPSSVSGSGRPSGGGTMFGPRTISTLCASSGGGGDRMWRSSTAGLRDAGVICGGSPSSRGSEISLKRRRGGRRRGAEVDLVPWRSAPTREVAVEGLYRGFTFRGSLADADAGATDGLEHPCAGGDEVLVDPTFGDGVENLPRARGHRHLYAGMHDVLAEDGRGGGEVLVRGVHRGADADLDRLRTDYLANRHDVARGGGFRDQRL